MLNKDFIKIDHNDGILILKITEIDAIYIDLIKYPDSPKENEWRVKVYFSNKSIITCVINQNEEDRLYGMFK